MAAPSTAELVAAQGYGYDVVLVFERGKDCCDDDVWRKWIRRFQDVGIECFAYASIQNDEVFVKIRASLAVLEAWAERIDHPVEFNASKLEAEMRGAAEAAGLEQRPVAVTMFERFGPFKYQRGPYRGKHRALYREVRGVGHPFGALHRATLLKLLMDAPKEAGGAGFGVLRRLSRGTIAGYLVLHDARELEALSRDFVRSRALLPNRLDVSMINEYFGEQLGFIFSFRQHLTTSLTPLALWGVVVYAATTARGDVSSWWTASFAAASAIWGVVCMQLWRRVESTNRMKWGVQDARLRKLPRAGFHGALRPSPVDGLPELFFAPHRRRRKVAENLAPALALIAIFGLSFWGITLLKFRLADERGGASLAPAVVNAVSIQILNLAYAKLAVKLTNRENWRTDQEHADALILRMFLFQFVNSFSPLYFTAFVRPYVGHGGCDGDRDGVAAGSPGDACIHLLSSSLLVLYLSQIFVSKVTEQAVPLAIEHYRHWAESRGVRRDAGAEVRFSRAELELFLGEIDPELFHVNAMAAVVVEFGYVTLFVAAFPLAPLLSYVNGCVSLRSNAHVLMYRSRRAMPRASEGIGNFNTIFDLMTRISVVTNAALLVYVSSITYLDALTPVVRLWIFIIFQYVLFSIQTAIDILVPDEIDDVRVQRDRGTFFRGVLDAGEMVIPAPRDEAHDAPSHDVELHGRDDGAYYAHWISGALAAARQDAADLRTAGGAVDVV
ncbi:intracellular chloride channel [Aureococcus anophagefferens]|uniref:Intracellular chloride channel n=1 Tax=Aureococcus anophagefferens TaxID=44056 RepID=A0ABR1G8Q3_AURAN